MAVNEKAIITVEDLEYTKQTTDACIAPVETSATASKAYTVGKRFWFKGKLCICTADIASGGTITLNTNCVLDVLGDDVGALESSFNEYQAHSYTRIIVGNGYGKWVQGGHNTNTSAYTTTNYKVRSGADMKNNNIFLVESDDSSYQFVALCYKKTDGTYEGIYQPATNTYVKSSTGTGFDWYTSLEIALLDGRSYAIMVRHYVEGAEVTLTPDEVSQHFKLYRYSTVTNETITKYASEDKQIIDAMVTFEPGGISSNGDYYDGNTSYQNMTRRSSFIIPNCKVGDLVCAEIDNANYDIRLYVFKSDSSIELIGYDIPYVSAVHEEGNKYKVTIQYPPSGTISTVDVINAFRVYIKEKPTTPIAVTPSKKQFCVMSYNVGQWYNGSGAILQTDMELMAELNTNHRDVLNRSCPDILCCQEYTPKLNILGDYYKDFYTFNSANNNIYSAKAIATNYEQSESTGVEYTNQYNSTVRCNYMYSYVWLNGRKICIVSTHLSTDAATAKLQMAELITFAETQDYIIICGDFNLNCSAVTDENYVDGFKPWVDAGYNMANYSNWGFMTTCYNTLSDAVAIDNIITSGNIEITYACVDYQKRDAALDSKIDHMPIIAYVKIKEEEENPNFVVTLTPTAQDFSGTMDKTVAEIYEAYQAGKRIFFRVYTSETSYAEADCISRGRNTASGDYPSFNAYIINEDINALIYAYTGVSATADSTTYSTKVFSLTPMT